MSDQIYMILTAAITLIGSTTPVQNLADDYYNR